MSAAARLWRLARSVPRSASTGLCRCDARECAAAIIGGDHGLSNVGLGGLDFRRGFATTKKGAVTPKAKTKKGPQAAKGGKKGAAGGKGSGKGGAGASEGGGGSTGTVGIEDYTIKEPGEIAEDNLFTGARKVHEITAEDINKYFHISEEDVTKYFTEGFPKGVMKEFEMSRSRFVRVRRCVLEIINKLQYSATGEFAFVSPEVLPYNLARDAVFVKADKPKASVKSEESDTSVTSEEGEKSSEEVQDKDDTHAEDEDEEAKKDDGMKLHISSKKDQRMRGSKHHILDGPVGCGKSFALAVIVQWARAQGWLVFYVPRGQEWTRGGYYYLNELTGLWDTPIQAQKVLREFLDSHGEMLEQIKCRVPDPIFLGEAAALGRIPGPQEITMPENSTVKDLVEKGLDVQAAASNIVVRLRQELDLVTEFPVLIAVDEFNSWFTFSEYHQFLDFKKTRQIHAKELGMVSAFRRMETSRQLFVGAFSQSTAVGKLPLELPGAPKRFRIDVARADKEEIHAAIRYYHKQNLLHNEPQEDAINRLFFLTNGNGAELRKLVRYI
ncbi:uncharacterized protein LOC9659848 [Selaginella moellendorffii]|uniref:uncharacterized protein LOC9659848 n=1 Tax=Selaginella moellendorffii TaxID=88036 RepID=UPI000D1CF2A1|nr:uncharacterized protein LOC9659848 [Selaginella moellendorffii]|eukprot:XP_002986606.2 uncharacterized protein LOC9659848 [Selaginella moellendorffii]